MLTTSSDGKPHFVFGYKKTTLWENNMVGPCRPIAFVQSNVISKEKHCQNTKADYTKAFVVPAAVVVATPPHTPHSAWKMKKRCVITIFS